MDSKGRIPPHMRRPLPGPGLLHPEPLGLGIPGLLPPPEVMEQKFTDQHVEMQRLDTENHRLAATHGTLRQELAAAQRELQMLHVHIGASKAEREQQMRNIMDKIAKMESELQAAEPLKLELQQARAEAQNLVISREELIAKAQHLNQDLHRTHADVLQIPALVSELECLRQEYQHCRAAFGYEKKLYHDHLESLQVMEKNYISMATEVEKLQAELTNTANVDRRSGGPYGGTPGTIENEASGLTVAHNAYGDGYGATQGHVPFPSASGDGATIIAGGAQPGQASARTGYDASRGYDASVGPAYDALRGVMHNAQRLTGYDAAGVSAYDSQRGAIYDAHRTGHDPQQRGLGYDVQRGFVYDASRAGGYDAQSKRCAAGHSHGHAPLVNDMPGGSATPPAAGGGFKAPPQGGNPVRK